MSRVVYWDLDGTLLTTNRGGVVALEDACEQVLGRRTDLSLMKTAGLTDREIATAIVQDISGSGDPELEIAFLAHYAAALPERLTQRRGHVMPNVLEVLARCADRDVTLALLTGNLEQCAYAKLTSYGIDPSVFSFGGFAEDGHTRVEIAAAALSRSGGRAAWESAFLVGDTPSDVAAGLAHGLTTIAVATGGFGADELRETNAWCVLDNLPHADEFCVLIGAA